MASWNHDGTQDPGPPPLMTDPLSGLVTGGKYQGESVRIRVVEPAMPDIEKVRTAMESVLDENSELRVDLLPGKPAKAAAPKQAVAPTGKLAPAPPAAPHRQGVTPAEIPPQRSVKSPRPRWSPGLTAVGLLLLVMAVLAIVMLASLIDAISAIFN